jgi:choline kinase
VKAVILAAGVASRLRPWTDRTPKCLLPIGDGTLLDRTLEAVEAAGLRDIVLVTGYLEEQIRARVRERHARLNVEFVRNADFATTNNIYSLWLARDRVAGEGMLLLDSDILFDPAVLDDLRNTGRPDVLAVKTGHTLGEEEIKVEIDAARRVLTIGKRVPPERAFGESIGIEIFSPSALVGLFEALENKVVREGAVGVFYEAAFQDWIDGGGTITAVDIGARPAIEIDTIDDFRAAERDVLPLLPKLRS